MRATLHRAARLAAWPFLHSGSNRLRAGWRALLPAALALATLVALATGLSRVLSQVLAMRVATTVMGALSVGLLLVWGRYVDGRSLADYGLVPDARWGREFLLGVAVAVLALGGAFVSHLALGWATVRATLAGGTLSVGLGIASVLVARLGVAVWEEAVFRGLVLRNLADGLDGTFSRGGAVAGATLLSGALFGLLHGNQVRPVQLGLWVALGVLLGGAYVLTDSLALPVGLHFGIDAAFASGFGLAGTTRVATLVRVEYAGPAGLAGPVGLLNAAWMVAVPTLALAALALARGEPLRATLTGLRSGIDEGTGGPTGD
jgi:hypothetical protein